IVWGGLGGRVAVRRRNSGVWGTWNRMWSTEDAPAVLGTTGRQTLPNGLLLQWGAATLPASGGTSAQVPILWPIAFPTACVHVSAIANQTANTGNGGSPAMTAVNITPSGCTLNGDVLGWTAFNRTVPCMWMATGY
ncbi:gp53-like domain-containing protein, partial [Meridianimarinicoccus sp. RP-17]